MYLCSFIASTAWQADSTALWSCSRKLASSPTGECIQYITSIKHFLLLYVRVHNHIGYMICFAKNPKPTSDNVTDDHLVPWPWRVEYCDFQGSWGGSLCLATDCEGYKMNPSHWCIFYITFNKMRRNPPCITCGPTNTHSHHPCWEKSMAFSIVCLVSWKQ